MTYDDALAIGSQINGVAGVATERNASASVKFESVVLDEVPIIGTTTDYPAVRDVEVGEGRFFNATELERASKVTVLGASLAEDLFGGTSTRVDPIAPSPGEAGGQGEGEVHSETTTMKRIILAAIGASLMGLD